MGTLTKMTLTGRRACGGIATGRPVVVRKLDDLSRVLVGDILVARETDISFVAAMQRAAAIVTETGGRFSHVAVWARENKKPAIIQVKGAMEMLASIAMVTVNADAAVVSWTIGNE